ncbi:MAG TPA: protein kinase [Thermoanaerobaculia bacterium]|jgi:predicted Ser/Thr protein kinase/tetratricopeptide (TPR) repeat protein
MELVGQRFGHIRVTQVVGSGGMGDVYGGYDEKLERKVALKTLAPEQRPDVEARERLLREARALSRLDHPNICRIHDYIESDEVDLLVLEYIDGRTLAEVMTETTSRAEKLRIAAAIANVLVAAHRAGIVHRDLKPDNVMLTKAGEVKVLDFGLARWLQRPRAAQQLTGKYAVLQGGSSYDTAAPLETAIGITLGTPLYMSPEQARGEALTPASDMYSFGLLLQALFTGMDPHPMGLSAREVMLRAARGETNPVSGVAGDVAALIHRLKQFAPADRPTAIEAVERLKFLADKTQRIARRAAASAFVALLAFGGWRYTVDLKTERAKAIAAQGEAERRRAQAEDLIEFMLGDLHKKLGSVGRLDVLDDVANRALMYVSSLNPETVSAEELARNSKALNQVGDVRIGQGNVAEARRVFEKSLQLSTAALRKAPNDPRVQLAHATSHYWVGNARRLEGDLPRALHHMTEYQKGTTRLAREHPDNDEYQRERASGHDAVGTVLEAKGDLAKARDEYRLVLAIQTARLQRDPSSAGRQHDVAFARKKLGQCCADPATPVVRWRTSASTRHIASKP